MTSDVQGPVDGPAGGDVGTLEVRTDERTLIAALVGDIDVACSGAIESQLSQELDRDVDLVVLDLRRTTYLDSSGVRMIFWLARSLSGDGRGFRLVVSDEAIVRRVVILSRLDAAVPIFSTLDDAVSPSMATMHGSLTLPATNTSPKAARDFIREVLARAGLSAACVEEAVLAANELVTNAILHARTECVVRVDLNGEVIRIEVEDGDLTPPRQQPHEADAATGRGLVLLERVAAEWGHELRPDGKVVWCEVRRSG